MTKSTIALFVVLAIIPTCKAAPRVNVASRAELAARQKVVDSLASIHASALDWQIFIISDKDWREGFKHNRCIAGHLVTGSAYSSLGPRITYLDASWVMTHTRERVAEALAHEWGHILCQCTDENAADARGQQIVPWKITSHHW